MTKLQIVQRFYPNVTKVIDAGAPIRVEVTDSDVKKSSRRNHNECAFAQACKRTLKADGMIVAIKTAYIIKGNKAVRFTVGDVISREITAFDRNASFEPGVYNLEAAYASRNYKRKGGAKPSKQKALRNHKKVHRTANIRTALGTEVAEGKKKRKVA